MKKLSDAAPNQEIPLEQVAAPETALPLIVPEIGEQAPPDGPRPWRFWPTIGLTLGIGVCATLAQIVFAVGWVAVLYLRDGGIDPAYIKQDSNFLLGCVLFSYPFVIGLMLLLIKLRKHNTLTDYLALKKVGWKPVAIWAGWLFGLMVVTEIIASLVNHPAPDFMLAMATAVNRGLMLAMLLVGAPLVEEFVFRGFMFRGIAASRVGGAGAVVLTTLLWAAIHGLQYDWFALVYLALFGTILGMARLKTGSVVTPLILHMANNAVTIFALIHQTEQGIL